MTSAPTIDQVQIQLDETKDILLSNVTKVLERDCKLTDLEQRSDSLRETASIFQHKSTTFKRKMWWKNNIQFILLLLVSIGLLLALILPLTLKEH